MYDTHPWFIHNICHITFFRTGREEKQSNGEVLVRWFSLKNCTRTTYHVLKTLHMWAHDVSVKDDGNVSPELKSDFWEMFLNFSNKKIFKQRKVNPEDTFRFEKLTKISSAEWKKCIMRMKIPKLHSRRMSENPIQNH